jgi:hypothetical protein
MFAVASTVVLLGCLDEPTSTIAQSAGAEAPSVNAPVPANAVQEDIPPVKAVIPPAHLSPGIAEVVKLAESGVGDEVLLAYIDKSNRSFNPTVEEIVYLKDLGLSEPVMASLVRQGNGNAPTTQAPAPAAAPENQNLPQQIPAPANAPSLVDPSSSVAASAPLEAPFTAPQQIDINYFENTLAPYGTWVEVADYGRCWQPTVVVINRDWRPYGDRGRWIYTTSGWYWQSDYSWGWAPFHYGRWHCDNRVGWVWVPDTTWGPSWVSWRYSNDYCGWAPLPPSARFDFYGGGFRYHNTRVGINFDFGLRADFYTFIPTSRLCDRSPHHYYAPRTRNTTIYNNSVVINNYIRGDHNTVINEGVGRDRVSKASRTPIRTVALRDLPSTTSPIGRADRIEGNSVTVYRPNVSSTRSTSHSGMRQQGGTTSASPTPSGSSTTVSGTSQRSSTFPSRTGTVRPPQTETAAPSVTTAPTVAPNVSSSSSQVQPTRRTPTAITRSAPQVEPRHTDRVPSAIETRPNENVRSSESSPERTRGNSSITRQSPSPTVQNPISQNQNPAPRNTPTTVRENPRQYEAPLTPRPSTRSEQVISPRSDSARPEVSRSERSDSSVPRSIRSMETPRSQPTFTPPANFNRGSSVERSPQVLQSPRAQETPAPAARAQSVQREQRAPDRSEKSSHDKKNK